MEIIRARIFVYGIVQGVGFRPFVNRLVKRLGLFGWIRNTSDGAEIEVEGPLGKIDDFAIVLGGGLSRGFSDSLPSAAMIEDVKWEILEGLKGYDHFEIIQSRSLEKPNTLVSPDICVCRECLSELMNPADRRYRYPFINCTNCGPRFTIIKDVPYDRARTSMADFPMCPDCGREYKDIDDRRFHAQPDACSECGPHLNFETLGVGDKFQSPQLAPDSFAEFSLYSLIDAPTKARSYKKNSSKIGNRFCGKQFSDRPPGDRLYEKKSSEIENQFCREQFLERTHEAKRGEDEAALSMAKRFLREGKIVAIKGLGGFHLAARADDEKIAALLRERKHRDEKPFAIMVADASAAEKFCVVSAEEKKLLESGERPIVLLKKKCPGTFMHLSENNYIGVMLPYTPLHYLLMQDFDALIMTSANLSDRPIIYKNEEALEKLGKIADGFLMHDREIVTRCDDSLCYCVDGREYFVRRSRGYAPMPVKIDVADRLCGRIVSVLACGAEQKASFAMNRGRYVFAAQHIGDLKNPETFENYEGQIKHFEKLFGIEPKIVACDLHPDYLSSGYALERTEDAPKNENRLIRVQHHHAHMAACMADNDLDGEVIGIIWDGTGLGAESKKNADDCAIYEGGIGVNAEPDGTIWGGEFLVGGYKKFRRAGTILPFALPGGDAVAKELWRAGLSLLKESGIELGEMIGAEENEKRRIVEGMLKAKINCPVCTSMGRLFDGVAAILGIKEVATYEGQGAVLLEAKAEECCGRKTVPPESDKAAFSEKWENEFEIYPYKIFEKDGIYYFDYREMVREIYFVSTKKTRLEAGNDLESSSSRGSLRTSMDMRDREYMMMPTNRRNVESEAYGTEQNEEISRLQSCAAAKFMNTLVAMAADMCEKIRNDTGLSRVVLSGGTFQNMYMLERLEKLLSQKGFLVYHHKRVATNDEGLSLGQLAVALKQ